MAAANQSVMPVVWMPATVQEAFALYEEYFPDVEWIAGGTWRQIEREKGTAFAGNIIALEQVSELTSVHEEENYMRIGACMTLEELIQEPYISREILGEALRQIAAPAVRTRGTMGGNIMYGHGDALPALMALQAELEVWNGRSYARLPVEEAASYEGTFLLTAVLLPKTPEASGGDVHFFEKIGRREAFTASLLAVSGCARRQAGGSWKARLALVGGKDAPVRLRRAEACVAESGWTPEAFFKALEADYQPGDEPFSSGSYRLQAAAHLFLSRLWLEDNAEKGGVHNV
ncbi:FAD binding domain-containing protein [Marinococcus halophilus]|uniref:FAD binding domain-containing protein n=1 Tax=Marinococcus halophilus TaxID=1371 RepID=UPI0009A5AA6A|nr:FAD binding domain-containing protein [Marinococcus halophilus]